MIICSCGNEPEAPENKKENPVTVQFFETYDIDDIKEEWLDAFKWTAETSPQSTDSEKEWAEQFTVKGLRSVVINGYEHAIALVKTEDIPAVDSMLAIPEVAKRFPKDLRFMWSKYEQEDPATPFKGCFLYAVRIPANQKAPVDSHDILESIPADSDQNQLVDLHITMTENGARKLEKFTRKNENKAIAVILEGKVVSCPLIREPIKYQMNISSFTMEQAGEISDRINAGRYETTKK
ncbi:hypothetical protein [Fluviicola sp.]|uniref:SecDF P1 head subdomain-containing protein n=1 Tax=Fluviicola sp. TaxID=1917219 RepID=UPI0031D2ADF0